MTLELEYLKNLRKKWKTPLEMQCELQKNLRQNNEYKFWFLIVF